MKNGPAVMLLVFCQVFFSLFFDVFKNKIVSFKGFEDVCGIDRSRLLWVLQLVPRRWWLWTFP